MLFAALSALALASAASAATPVVTVQVGSTAASPGGIFQYIPSSFNATNGTIVSFQFSGIPGNHSVTQSSFANPCQPLAGGFDSGWVQILNNETEIPEFNVTITNDSKPLWFYCKQLSKSPHCIAGMVGAINAPVTGNTFAAFQTAARASSGTPGQAVGHLVGIGASASAPVGPLPSGVINFGTPSPGAASATASGTASAASGSGAATASGSAASSSPSSGASQVAASSIVALLAAALGFAMV